MHRVIQPELYNTGTVNPKAMASTGINSIAICVSEDFWSNTSAISSRSRHKGLRNAVEGYIQNIKISNEWETTKIEAKAYRCQVALSGQPRLSKHTHKMLQRLK